MKRNEFLKVCSALGIGLPFHNLITACEAKIPSQSFSGKVLIIGAGAAGMTCGYLLNQLGIEYEILEASSTYGGRIKTSKDFADFPIPLGGEWIHAKRDVLNEIINDSSVSLEVKTVSYAPESTYGWWSNGKLELSESGKVPDLKFSGSSWLNFFEDYILPSISNKISYDKVVKSIDYSSSRVSVIDIYDKEYKADKVVVTVPVKMLQNRTIDFNPQLPEEKLAAIDGVKVWEGMKVFIEFSKKFYPTFIEFDIKPASKGQKMYYDASYGQDTDKNILGLFTVGSATKEIMSLDDDQLIDFILSELNEILDMNTKSYYIKHISQNWVKEPFINGAYISDRESWRKVRELGKAVGDKLHFAGCAYTNGNNWSNVHTAARSAASAVKNLV